MTQRVVTLGLLGDIEQFVLLGLGDSPVEDSGGASAGGNLLMLIQLQALVRREKENASRADPINR